MAADPRPDQIHVTKVIWTTGWGRPRLSLVVWQFWGRAARASCGESRRTLVFGANEYWRTQRRDFFFANSTFLRARFLIHSGVPTKPNALRIWFSRNR